MVDTEVDLLYGPHAVQRIGTVTVPKDLLRAMGLNAGSRVHWALNPHLPGTLVLIPSAQVARAMEEILKEIGRVGR